MRILFFIIKIGICFTVCVPPSLPLLHRLFEDEPQENAIKIYWNGYCNGYSSKNIIAVNCNCVSGSIGAIFHKLNDWGFLVGKRKCHKFFKQVLCIRIDRLINYQRSPTFKLIKIPKLGKNELCCRFKWPKKRWCN